MGTKLAPSFANLFMGDFEEKFVETYHLQPFIWTYGSEELENFVNHLNTRHNPIKFTCESSENSIDFFDITLKKSPDNSLETTLYCKPTNTHNYLYSSEHPRHLLKGIPFSQLLRVQRICAKTTEFIKKGHDALHPFQRRGYPKHLVKAAYEHSLKLNRDELLNRELLKSTTLGEKKGKETATNSFYLITTHNTKKPNYTKNCD